jgi:hypothetical protein
MNIFSYIKKKLFEPRETVLTSNSLSISEIRDKLGKKYENLSDEELMKIITESPPQELFDVFFNKK